MRKKYNFRENEISSFICFQCDVIISIFFQSKFSEYSFLDNILKSSFNPVEILHSISLTNCPDLFATWKQWFSRFALSFPSHTHTQSFSWHLCKQTLHLSCTELFTRKWCAKTTKGLEKGILQNVSFSLSSFEGFPFSSNKKKTQTLEKTVYLNYKHSQNKLKISSTIQL